MASYSGGLNPNVVKTALDDVFMQEHNVMTHPNAATAETPSVFHQETADSSAIIWEAFKGVGLWTTRQEEQDVPQDTPRIANQKTFTVTNYAKSIDIPKNFFDDNKHGAYEKMVKDFAQKARITRDSNAFAVFRNAFTTATTHDGTALCSDTHTALNGGTVDNLGSGDLSESNLNVALIQLAEMKDQSGIVNGNVADTLVVSLSDFKLACEITESELRSATGDNDINIYSTKYGIKVATSPYLGAAGGGDDDNWFLLARNHSIYRFVRQAVQTTLVPWENQRNNNYIYKGEFRETVGAMSWEGIVGFQGV